MHKVVPFYLHNSLVKYIRHRRELSKAMSFMAEWRFEPRSLLFMSNTHSWSISSLNSRCWCYSFKPIKHLGDTNVLLFLHGPALVLKFSSKAILQVCYLQTWGKHWLGFMSGWLWTPNFGMLCPGIFSVLGKNPFCLSKWWHTLHNILSGCYWLMLPVFILYLWFSF